MRKSIIDAALKSGFDDCGIIPARDFPEYSETLDRISKRFPETAGIYSNISELGNVKKNNPWAESIIVCIRRYNKYTIPEGVEGIGKNYLFDSRVSENPDFHKTDAFTRFLRSSGEKVRKGSVPDRLAAALAGVASIGRNNFAYTKWGSYVNINTWLTSLKISSSEKVPESPCPEGCRICVKNCPTGAIVEPYLTRPDRCIAYLTYFAKLPISEELEKRMGGWVYGCDICQDVCPLNKDKWRYEETLPHLDRIASYLNPETLQKIDPQTYKNKIHPYFWYIPVESLDRWHHNARRAIKNKKTA